MGTLELECGDRGRRWIDAIVQAGLPDEYGGVLRTLTETIPGGRAVEALDLTNDDVLKTARMAPARFAELAARL